MHDLEGPSLRYWSGSPIQTYLLLCIWQNVDLGLPQDQCEPCLIFVFTLILDHAWINELPELVVILVTLVKSFQQKQFPIDELFMDNYVISSGSIEGHDFICGQEEHKIFTSSCLVRENVFGYYWYRDVKPCPSNPQHPHERK